AARSARPARPLRTFLVPRRERRSVAVRGVVRRPRAAGRRSRPRMTRLRVSAVAAFGVLLVVGMLTGEDPRPLSPTTFGTVPAGYRALFELLTELGFPVTRSHVTPDALAPPATRWWLEARGLCRVPLRGAVAPRDWRGGSWVEAGGPAVVFLPPARDPERDLVVAVPVPAPAPLPH